MRILLAGGGTAGHIEPAMNTADELMARDSQNVIYALGTDKGLEMRLVPERGYPLELIPAVPLPRRPNLDLIKLPARLRHSVKAVRDVMERTDAQVVVGFGGYVAMPAYIAARGRIPIVIHEANAKAGIANKIGARFARSVAQAVPGSISGATTIGIPVRRSILDLNRGAARVAAREYFELDADKPCLLVFGGSQGARRINAALIDALPQLLDAGMQVLHIAGTRNDDQVADASGTAGYRRLPYVSRMDLAYAAADLALCRSGAMTCAELATVGLPAIYVPLPIGNGEQRLNARKTVDAGGGVFMSDTDLSGQNVADMTIELLRDSDRRTTMERAASSVGSRDAGAELAQLVEEAVANGEGASS